MLDDRFAQVSHPSLFGPLSSSERHIEERLRTISMCICASGVVIAGLIFFRFILVPLVLAVALKYLLMPVIDALSVRPLTCCGRTFFRRPAPWVSSPLLRPFVRAACLLQLPRPLAILVAIGAAFAVLGLLGFVIAESVNVFASRAPVYSHQFELLTGSLLGWMESMQDRVSLLVASEEGEDAATNGTAAASVTSHAFGGGANSSGVGLGAGLEALAKKVPVTQLILSVVHSLLELVSNLFLVLLFTLYLLIGTEPPSGREQLLERQADAQIFSYVKGKVFVSFLTGALTALILKVLGLDLWLVFGVLAFWLNFVPNVGSAVAVLLPMPVVLLDPSFSALAAALALLLPLGVHGVVGNVVEPLLFGHSLELAPVVVLCSLMLWGAVWGVTGMLLAVPITAVLRIHLSHIDHPLPRSIAALLVGGGAAAAGAAARSAESSVGASPAELRDEPEHHHPAARTAGIAPCEVEGPLLPSHPRAAGAAEAAAAARGAAGAHATRGAVGAHATRAEQSKETLLPVESV